MPHSTLFKVYAQLAIVIVIVIATTTTTTTITISNIHSSHLHQIFHTTHKTMSPLNAPAFLFNPVILPTPSHPVLHSSSSSCSSSSFPNSSHRFHFHSSSGSSPSFLHTISAPLFLLAASATSPPTSSSTSLPVVVVTGAAGRTGKLVLKRLLTDASHRYAARGVVRDAASQKKLAQELGCALDQIVVADIQDEQAVQKAFSTPQALHALICVTSAVPKIKPFSIIKVMIAKIMGKQARPEFTFKLNQSPQKVDWIGQKIQFDMAVQCGCKHVILVGSQGGTNKDNFLNTLGNGNILLWKRKAERYLMEKLASSMIYTCIHPSGLVDTPGGKRKLIVGIDDTLRIDDVNYRTIPRDDVAILCIDALDNVNQHNRSYDVTTAPENSEPPTTDYVQLFKDLKGNNRYNFPVDADIDQMQ